MSKCRVFLRSRRLIDNPTVMSCTASLVGKSATLLLNVADATAQRTAAKNAKRKTGQGTTLMNHSCSGINVFVGGAGSLRMDSVDPYVFCAHVVATTLVKIVKGSQLFTWYSWPSEPDHLAAMKKYGVSECGCVGSGACALPPLAQLGLSAEHAVFVAEVGAYLAKLDKEVPVRDEFLRESAKSRAGRDAAPGGFVRARE
jgi:hypothetical protein